jgi:hypothetical protein
MASLFLRTFPTVALAATLGFAPPQLRAQTALNAAAVLPLPEAMRAGASIAEFAPKGQSKVVKKGTGMPWVMDSGKWIAHVMVELSH